MVRAAWFVSLLLSMRCLVGGTSVPSHSLRHAVNIAGDHARVHSALTMLEGLKGWTMAEVSRCGAAARPQPMNHSDLRHIKTAG